MNANKHPRGVRNNNPTNIRIGANFRGEIKGLDKEFATFCEPKYGIRAFFVLINTYQTKYNLNTIEKIVSRFAPSNENHTSEYIKSVSDYLGINKGLHIKIASPLFAVRLFKAFLRVECGREYENFYSEDLIIESYKLSKS